VSITRDRVKLNSSKFEEFSLLCAALLPTAAVVGSAVFEPLIALVGLSWLAGRLVAPLGGRLTWQEIGRHPLILPYVVWYIVIMLSFFYNNSQMDKLAYNLVFGRYIFFLAALLDISRRRPVLPYLLYGLAGGVLWAAVNSAMVHILGFDILGHPLGNYTEKRHEAPRIAQLAAFSAPFFGAWALEILGRRGTEKKGFLQRLPWLLALWAMASVLVFISDIRTYILAAVVGSALVVLFYGGRVRLKLLFAVVLLVSLAVVAGQHGWLQRLDTVNHRFYIWDISWRMFVEHPIWGVSTSSYQGLFPHYASGALASSYHLPEPYAPSWLIASHAHNLLLMILAVNGLLGGMAFIWLFTNAMRCLGRSAGHVLHLALLSWPGVFLTIGLLGTNIFDGATGVLFVFFLMIIVLAAEEKRVEATG